MGWMHHNLRIRLWRLKASQSLQPFRTVARKIISHISGLIISWNICVCVNKLHMCAGSFIYCRISSDLACRHNSSGSLRHWFPSTWCFTLAVGLFFPGCHQSYSLLIASELPLRNSDSLCIKQIIVFVIRYNKWILIISRIRLFSQYP